MPASSAHVLRVFDRLPLTAPIAHHVAHNIIYACLAHRPDTSAITRTFRSFTYTPRTLSMRYRRVPMRANYHPFLFTLMTLTAAAELGLTAFLISAGNEARSWSSSSYHSLSVPARPECRPRLTESHLHSSLILLCFSSAWTLLFSTAYVLWMVDGAVHLLAQVASSAFWLLLTSILWVCTSTLSQSDGPLTEL